MSALKALASLKINLKVKTDGDIKSHYRALSFN